MVVLALALVACASGMGCSGAFGAANVGGGDAAVDQVADQVAGDTLVDQEVADRAAGDQVVAPVDTGGGALEAGADAAPLAYCCQVPSQPAVDCAETPFLCGGGACLHGCALGAACSYCAPGYGGPGEPPCSNLTELTGAAAPCE